MQKEEVYEKDDLETKKKEKEEEVDSAVMLPDLPLCIIYEILSWLPVEDILRYRCVCKTWCDLLKDRRFIELQCSRSEVSRHPPFVVTLHGGRCLFRNISVNGRWTSMETNPDVDISDKICVASCNEFICISRLCGFPQPFPPLVYNPITREKIRLPEFKYAYKQCGFGFDKKTNRYKLILDFSSDSVPVITVGESSWRNIKVPSAMVELFGKRVGQRFFFNGGFNWVLASRVKELEYSVEGIITLDINTEEFRSIIFSSPLVIHTDARVVQVGNSIGFLHQNHLNDGQDHRSKIIKIWKILGAKSDGSCDYLFKTLNFPNDQYTPFNKSYMFELLAVLSNGDFLFKAWNYFGHYLVLYNQQKDEPSYFVDLQISGDKYGDKHVEIRTFLPTLMSLDTKGMLEGEQNARELPPMDALLSKFEK